MISVSKKHIIVTIISGFLVWAFHQGTQAGTFRDNFDDGDIVGWKPNIAIGISVIDGEMQFKGADSLIVSLGDQTWKGYSLEARVKIARFAGGGWFSVRILQGNAGDLSGYYELRLAQAGTWSALYIDNRLAESFRVPEPVEEGIWHFLRIVPANGKISFYLDENLIAQLTDAGLSGYIDMCSTKDTHAYVEDVSISGANIPDTGPSGPNSFFVKPESKLSITWGKLKARPDIFY